MLKFSGDPKPPDGSSGVNNRREWQVKASQTEVAAFFFAIIVLAEQTKDSLINNIVIKGGNYFSFWL